MKHQNRGYTWNPETKEWVKSTKSGDIVFKKVKNDRAK